MAYQDVGSDSGTSGSISDTKDTAKEQASRVSQTAAQAGGEVAQTTKEQAANVVGEAKQQARDLVGEARGQAREQASTQKGKAVQGLHGLSDQLDEMASSGSGVAAEVARQVSERARGLAQHVDRHEPAELLEQVRDYARRRPVVFLASCAVAGVLAGRLTKGLAAANSSDSGTPALPPAEPRTDTFSTAYEPLAGEPVYDPAPPVYDPVGSGYQPGYDQPGYQQPGYEQPAGGGFREPGEVYPGQAYPPGQTYPTGEPYPVTPPPANDPYQSDPQRGWNP
jgi:F0F1-type ATP synthase membrane subunit b/b'